MDDLLLEPRPKTGGGTTHQFEDAKPMPTPETWDETLASHPLTGDDAPPPAPRRPARLPHEEVTHGER